MPNPTTSARPPQRDSWFAPITLDLLVKVLSTTVFHPFVCWMMPLGFRARTMPWDEPTMVGAIAWAVLMTIVWMLGAVDDRIAHGRPRVFDLDEEVIVITGGAGGLGWLIAEVYGMRGASVAVLDIQEPSSTEARGVTFYKCDVGNKDDLIRVAAQIDKDLGPPTVVINNAAIVIGKSLMDMTYEQLDKSFNVNLLGPFYVAKAFLPYLTRAPNGGTLVTVSSVIGTFGVPELSDYAAAKAGLKAMHRSLKGELAKTHPKMRLVLVTPGQLKTPLFYGIEPPNSYIAPVVETVDLCKAVITAVDSGRHATLGMPFYARCTGYYDALPPGLQQLFRSMNGIDNGMDTFVGRRNVAEVEKERRKDQ